MSLADESPAEKRKNIVMLQWLVTIATSYLSLFNGGALNDDPLVLALVGVLVLTGLVLQKLPESILLSTRFNSLLVVGDVFLILFAIGLNRESPWDLFLLFFLCLYIAGIGPQSGIGGFGVQQRLYIRDIFGAKKHLARLGYLGQSTIFVRRFHDVRLYGASGEE